MSLFVIGLVLVIVGLLLWSWFSTKSQNETFVDARRFPEVVGMKAIDARKYLEAMGMRVRIVLTDPPVRDDATIYLMADKQSMIVRQL